MLNRIADYLVNLAILILFLIEFWRREHGEKRNQRR